MTRNAAGGEVLDEHQEIIRAIREGEVDAFVVTGPQGSASTACAAPTSSIAGWSRRCRKGRWRSTRAGWWSIATASSPA